jgi:2-methylisocitrate lyase-like PEP mutase family enzyme
MPIFTHRVHSAVARCNETNGVLCVEYSGLITPAIFGQLDYMLAPARARTMGAFENISNAITQPVGSHFCKSSWPSSTPVSIVIVRGDQWEQEVTFSEALAKIGVLRFAFPVEQFDQALESARQVFPYMPEGFFPYVRFTKSHKSKQQSA